MRAAAVLALLLALTLTQGCLTTRYLTERTFSEVMLADDRARHSPTEVAIPVAGGLLRVRALEDDLELTWLAPPRAGTRVLAPFATQGGLRLTGDPFPPAEEGDGDLAARVQPHEIGERAARVSVDDAAHAVFLVADRHPTAPVIVLEVHEPSDDLRELTLAGLSLFGCSERRVLRTSRTAAQMGRDGALAGAFLVLAPVTIAFDIATFPLQAPLAVYLFVTGKARPI